METKMSEQLIALINKESVTNVLECLERICDAKANDMLSKLENPSESKQWIMAAHIIRHASLRTEV